MHPPSNRDLWDNGKFILPTGGKIVNPPLRIWNKGYTKEKPDCYMVSCVNHYYIFLAATAVSTKQQYTISKDSNVSP